MKHRRSSHRTASALAVAGAAVLSACTGPLSVAALAPEVGPAGTLIEIAGANFDGDDRVVVKATGGAEGAVTVAPVVVTSSRLVVEIPRFDPGDLQVQVERADRLLPAAALRFTVTSHAVYYVSPTGDDEAGDGSASRPFHTLETAAQHMNPGDVTYVRGGTYSQSNSIHASGTVDAPLTFTAFPGEAPLFSAPESGFRSDTLSISGSFVVVSHLRITDEKRPGEAVAIDGSHVTISECEIFGAKGQGVIVTGDHNVIARNSIHDNGYRPHIDHGIYLSGSHNRIQGNAVFDNADNGVQLFNMKGSLTDNVIERNYIYHNGYLLDKEKPQPNAGIIVDASPSNSQSKVVIRNNRVCDNAYYGIYVIDGVTDVEVTGNVTCFNRQGGYQYLGPGSGLKASGNISYNDQVFAVAAYSRAPIESDGNVYFNSGRDISLQWNYVLMPLEPFRAASGLERESRTEDPMFANAPRTSFDSAAAPGYDFHTHLIPEL